MMFHLKGLSVLLGSHLFGLLEVSLLHPLGAWRLLGSLDVNWLVL